MKELSVIKMDEKGKLAQVIQKIDECETDEEKAKIALAVKEKMSKKVFKRHKKKEYLMELINKVNR